MVLDDGYAWNGCFYRSLSQVAKAITGTNWNGHRFFGLKAVRNGAPNRKRSARTAILPARPRKPRRATPLTDRNCEGFCPPGNHVGLPGLHGGGRSPAEPVSDGLRSLG